MVSAVNTFNGGVAGATITIGASGGYSGDPWDVVSVGTGATCAFDAGMAAHGALGCKIATGSTSASPFVAWTEARLGKLAVSYGCAYFRFSAFPAANHRIVSLLSGGLGAAAILLTTTGVLRFVDANGSTIGSTGSSVATNQIVRIEWKVTGHASAGQVEVRLYNSAESGTATSTYSSAASYNTRGLVDTWRFGLSASQANVVAYGIDSVQVNDTGWIGPFDPYNQTITDTISLSTVSATDAGVPDRVTTFNGTSTYAEIPDDPAWSIPTTGALTVVALMRPDSLAMAAQEGSGYVHWLGKGEAGTHEWTFRMYQAGNTENRVNRISCYAFNPAGGLGNGSYFQDVLVPGQWIMVAGAWDATSVAIYRDGVLRDTDLLDQSATGGPDINPADGDAPLRIGTRDLGSFFQGAIARVAIYNRRLPDAQVAALQAARAAGGLDAALLATPGLVGFWKLNEQAGSTQVAATVGPPGTWSIASTSEVPGALSAVVTTTARPAYAAPVRTPLEVAVTGSHRVALRLEVLRGGWSVRELLGTVTGQIDIERTAIRRRLSLTLTQADLDFSIADALNLLYGNELRISRGVTYPDGWEDVVPIGVFGVGDVAVHWPRVELSGYDRGDQVSRARFTDSYVIAAGTPIDQAILAIVGPRCQATDEDYDFAPSAYTTPQLVYDVQADPWEAAKALAASAGMDLHFDPDGRCVLAPEADPATATPQRVLGTGAGSIILSVQRAASNRSAYNGLVVTGESSSIPFPVRAVAWDTDPASPTYYLGPYGMVPRFYVSPLITTGEQAQSAANAMLRAELGLSEEVELEVIADPTWDVGEIVRVVDPDNSLDAVMVTDRISLPLLGGKMSVTLRNRADVDAG